MTVLVYLSSEALDIRHEDYLILKLIVRGGDNLHAPGKEPPAPVE
jgi:hypothetical protein